MRYIVSVFALLMLYGAQYALAAGPVPARHITVTAPEGQAVQATPAPSAPAASPAPAVRPEVRVDPSPHDTLTVNGKVSGLDPASRTIRMDTQAGEMSFSYDGETRFQSGLRPIDMSLVKTGSRIAVLYTVKDGRATLKRLMLVPDKSYGPTKPGSRHKSKHKAKKSRKSKRHTKKAVKKKPKKKTRR